MNLRERIVLLTSAHFMNLSGTHFGKKFSLSGADFDPDGVEIDEGGYCNLSDHRASRLLSAPALLAWTRSTRNRTTYEKCLRSGLLLIRSTSHSVKKGKTQQ